ncbi:MAG: T9SS type A sorting domain-containing protein [Calditrichaeota bacterium]|nr:T9SS type A sorting domain-containing protein [Calditrichota bacterium]
MRFVATTALLFLILAIPLFAQDFGSVSGTISNENGDLVANTNIMLNGRGEGPLRTQSDENGAFNFAEVPVGEWTVQITGRGYLPFREDIEVAVDQAVELEIVLEVAGGRGDDDDDEDIEFGSVSGMVANEDGEAVAEARVMLNCPGQRPLQAQTDENGAFSFAEVPVGEWAVQIAGRGYLPFREDIEVAVDQVIELEIVLEVAGGRGGDDDEEVEFGSVSGMVANEDGEAVAEARVMLNSRGQRPLQAQTDENGAFNFAEVPVGEWTGQITGRGYIPFREDIEVAVDQAVELEIVLEVAGGRGDDDDDEEVEFGSVSGMVSNENGEAVAEARVILNGRGQRPLQAQTDENGAFNIAEVLVGAWTVQITGRAYLPFREDIEVAVDQAVELEIVLEVAGGRGGDDEEIEFGTVSGTVANEDGEAVAEARVMLNSRGQRPLQAQTDENGAFNFAEVPVWEWTVQITGRGYLPFREDIEVAVDQAVELEIVLEVAGGRGDDDDEEVEFGRVSGTVANEDGEAIAEATVLISSRGHRSQRVNSSENGEFNFDEVPVGEWAIQVSGRGFDLHRGELAVEVNQVVELEIVLAPFNNDGEIEMGSVSVSVNDENENPIELANIRLVPANRENWRLPGWMRPAVGFTNEEGLYAFDDVPTGEYLARASKRGFEFADLELEVVVDENSELAFVLVARGERLQLFGGLDPLPLEEIELRGSAMIVESDNGRDYLLDVNYDNQADYLLNFGPDYYQPGNGAVRPDAGDEITVPGMLVGHMEPQMLIVAGINDLEWRDVYLDFGGQLGFGSGWNNYDPNGLLVEAEGFNISGGFDWQDRCLIDVDEDNNPDYRLIFGDETYDPETGIDLPDRDRFTNIIGAEYQAKDGIPIIIVYQIDGVFWREPGTTSGLDWNGAQSADNSPVQTPREFALIEAFPNPFNPEVTISISLPNSNQAELVVFDIKGREITTIHSGYLIAGQHSFILNGRDLNAGIYFVRMEFATGSVIQKLTLLK